MLRPTSALSALALVLSIIASADAAAAAQRTFVASTGNDANACSIVAPCRGFAAAIAQTVSGGEVIVLDSAGYGPVTISQPVSIIAPQGVYAGISVFSGTGVVVNPGSGTVVLSGLTINGLGGLRGINFQSGSVLRIERTIVSGFLGNALFADLSAAATLSIRDSAFLANVGSPFIRSSGGVATVEIDSSRFERNSNVGAIFADNVSGVVSGASFSSNNDFGVSVGASTAGASTGMTFRNCVFSSNSGGGIFVGGFAGATNTMQVTDSEISDNASDGIQAQTTAMVTVSNTTLTRNGTGLVYTGGTVLSFQDNRLFGNGAASSFTGPISKQ